MTVMWSDLVYLTSVNRGANSPWDSQYFKSERLSLLSFNQQMPTARDGADFIVQQDILLQHRC